MNRNDISPSFVAGPQLVWRDVSFLFPLAAALGIGAGVTVLLVSVFNYLVGPMVADLGLSRTELSGALSAHLASLVVALPVGGFIADRIGARRLIIGSAILYAGALFAISRASASAVELYLVFIVAGFAGAGVAPPVYNRVIVHRFTAHRGLALGIALSGGGLANILLPRIIRPIVLADGWRAGFETLALIALLVGLSVGAVASETRSGPCSRTADDGSSLGQALFTRAFWLMATASAILGLQMSAVASHWTELFAGLHFSTATVPFFQASIGTSTIIGRLFGGMLMDRVPAQFVGTVAAMSGAAGLFLLAFGDSSGMLLVAAGVGIGFCTGAESDVVSFLSSRCFGVRNFGRIYAVQASVFLIGFSIGPVLAAALLPLLGAAMLLAAAGACLIVSGLILLMLRPDGPGPSPNTLPDLPA